MWIFKRFVFFWLNGGYQGPTKTECPGGQGMVQWCRLVHMHVRGWGWARRPAVTSGVRGLCSADNCHALYCTRPQSLPGPFAFQGISPSPARACLPPAGARLFHGSPRRTGAREGVGFTSRGPLPS